MTRAERDAILTDAVSGARPSREQALALAECADAAPLIEAAAALRERGHGRVVTYSRKVFVPLTRLCRDVCHYCTFAQPPRRDRAPYLTPAQVLDIARAGAAAGCREALFTLGDKPELRYRAARQGLAALGHDSTLSYLAEAARLVFEETGLLPHLNPGVMTARDIAALRRVSVSQGLMLESASPRLCAKGGPHHGSPDKAPGVRLRTMRLAGEAAVPFTSGLLIGIGETRAERIESLLALREVHERHGHIQEVIVQNFRAKPGTRMAEAPQPGLDDHLWTIAVARLVLGAEMNIQAPPNLPPGALRPLLEAGINDWGGVSPVTPDHVNPEAPWPHLEALAAETEAAGGALAERLAVYPGYAQDPDRWLDPGFHPALRRASDATGHARAEPWRAGAAAAPPAPDLEILARPPAVPGTGGLAPILRRARDGASLREAEIVALFEARGADLAAVCAAADRLRAETCGDTVTYVVNRNINYTNVCSFGCGFCAFSKGRPGERTRDRPYELDLAEIARRAREAWARGATEVCLQGGIHPRYTGATYLDACRRVKAAAPGLHVHAFSPLEVWQGARTLGLGLGEFLSALRAAGLASLPGTAAEVLDDEVRAVICPDKLSTADWLEVMESAHALGLRSTATIMFGHVDRPVHWARHLMRVRALQARTGGFTEFVPLPFVAMEAPIYRKGRARPGPTFREAILMHAVARLALHPLVGNIQASWVKMGPEGARAALRAGANDLGGTLMNETITRSAGARHGQEMAPPRMEALIRSLDRRPRQRTTLYGPVPAERRAAAFAAPPLEPGCAAPPLRRRRAPQGAETRLSRSAASG